MADPENYDDAVSALEDLLNKVKSGTATELEQYRQAIEEKKSLVVSLYAELDRDRKKDEKEEFNSLKRRADSQKKYIDDLGELMFTSYERGSAKHKIEYQRKAAHIREYYKDVEDKTRQSELLVKAAHERDRKIAQELADERTKYAQVGWDAYKKFTSNAAVKQLDAIIKQQASARMALAGAGVQSGFGGINNLARDMLGGSMGAGGLFTRDEQLQRLTKIAQEAPKALKDVSGGMMDMIGTMGYFGSTVDETQALFIKASREQDFSQKDLIAATYTAAALQKNLGLNTKETTAVLVDMTKSLRGLGADAGSATPILAAFSKDMTALGQSVSAVEKMNLATRMAAGMGGLDLGQQLGLMQFDLNRPIQGFTEEDIGSYVSTPFENAQRIFEKISSQTGQSASEQMITAQKVGQLLGVNTQNIKEVAMLRDVLSDKSMTSKDIQDAIDKFDPAKVAAKGIDRLTETIGPIQRTENHLKNIYSLMSQASGPMNTALDIAGAGTGLMAGAGGLAQLSPYMSRRQRVMMKRGTRKVAGALMRSSGMRMAGNLATTGLSVGAGLVSSPVLLTSLAIAGLGYGAYKAYEYATEEPEF